MNNDVSSYKFEELYVLHLKCKNDKNGNPRRCFVIGHPKEGILIAIDEEYFGPGSLNLFGKEIGNAFRMKAVSLETTPRERKSLLKAYAYGESSQSKILDEIIKQWQTLNM